MNTAQVSLKASMKMGSRDLDNTSKDSFKSGKIDMDLHPEFEINNEKDSDSNPECI